jgi:lipopolysaccharide export LptBFGC system permease protein LptF
MSPHFNNMNELTSYLDAMENRVKTLESQNNTINQIITESGNDATKALPKTGLLSRSFFQRAFTVWGHYFVAQLLISLVLTCISLVIGLIVWRLNPSLINLFTGIRIP